MRRATSSPTILAAAFIAVASGIAAFAKAAPSSVPKGSVERVIVHGASLEGSLAGYSADREVFVYLPPGYRTNSRQRYPVLYSLHGFGGSGDSWVARLGAPEAFDRAIAAGSREMIVVMPDGRTPLGGVMFSNSVTTGDWETFIADDLVHFIDAKYRTVATRDARGLSGFSMGGYGTLRIAMKRPDAFSAIYALSSCCVSPQLPVLAPPGAFDGFKSFEDIKTQEDAGKLGFGAAPLGMASAWSPDPANPPLFLALPTRDGAPQPEVIASWAANSLLGMVHQYVPALRRLRAIAIDVGAQDGLLADNERLHTILANYHVENSFETYDGGHGDMIAERYEKVVFPYFSARLLSRKK